LIAAMIGLVNGVSFSKARLMTCAFPSLALISPLMSAPAENALSPAPVRITQRQSAASSSRSHSAARSAIIARDMALRRGSLAIVTTAMCDCCISRRISMGLVTGLSLRGAQRRRNLVEA